MIFTDHKKKKKKKRYLHSVRPLLNDEEYRNMEKLVEDFKRNEGKKLQFYLIGKSWITANYVYFLSFFLSYFLFFYFLKLLIFLTL